MNLSTDETTLLPLSVFGAAPMPSTMSHTQLLVRKMRGEWLIDEPSRALIVACNSRR